MRKLLPRKRLSQSKRNVSRRKDFAKQAKKANRGTFRISDSPCEALWGRGGTPSNFKAGSAKQIAQDCIKRKDRKSAKCKEAINTYFSPRVNRACKNETDSRVKFSKTKSGIIVGPQGDRTYKKNRKGTLVASDASAIRSEQASAKSKPRFNKASTLSGGYIGKNQGGRPRRKRA